MIMAKNEVVTWPLRGEGMVRHGNENIKEQGVNHENDPEVDFGAAESTRSGFADREGAAGELSAQPPV